MADLKMTKAEVLTALRAVVAQAHESIDSAARLLGADIESVAQVLAEPARFLAINQAEHAEVIDFNGVSPRTNHIQFGFNGNMQHRQLEHELKGGRYRVIIMVNRIAD